MFKSFRFQILVVFTLVMLVTAGGVSYFTKRDVSQAIHNVQDRAIQNLFNIIDRNIGDEYNRLIAYKAETIRELKNNLRSQTSLSKALYLASLKNVRIFTGRNELYIDEKTIGQIDRQWVSVLTNWFASDLRSKEVEWMIINSVGGDVFLSSTETVKKGKKISTFLDLNHRSLARKLTTSNLSISGEFAVFHFQSEDSEMAEEHKFLGYFMPIKNGEFIICAFSDLESRFAEEQRKVDQILSVIDDKQVGTSGFLIIFNKEREILGYPHKGDHKGDKAFYLYKENQYLWERNIDRFIERAENRGRQGTSNIVNISSSAGVQFEVTVRYFEGFDWYIAIVLPKDELRAPVNRVLRRQFGLIAGIFLLNLAVCIFLITKLTNPLELLARKIKLITSHDFTGADHSELTDNLPVTDHNEIGKLAETFRFMVNRLAENIQQLLVTTAANERMESELNVAREIQLGSLPTCFTFEPECKEIEIYADLIPAREVGGDLYDFYFLDEEHLCITVGDVAGKGVPAALFMVTAKKLIKNIASSQKAFSPADIMTQLNGMLYQDNPNATFVTLFIGILHVKTGMICYANGGHVPPIFTESDSPPSFHKQLSGPIVGVIPGLVYKDISMQLKPGGSIFLCTDGVTEAMNAEDQLFGDARLLEEFTRMQDTQDTSCKETVEGILHEVRAHAGQTLQSDDIAVMMVRWNSQLGEKNEEARDEAVS
nr:SpoIIE family protein phosphatase [Candidatus Electrothrix aestuarii]